MTQALSKTFARRPAAGFSLVELTASIAILLILSAIAVPTLMRSYRSYLLGDATSRVAGMAKLTRFEAIRRNTQISFQVQQAGSNWNIWMDTNGNGTADRGETAVVLTNQMAMLGSGSVPSSAPISTANGGATLTVKSGSNAAITYDGRGAVFFGGGASAVYVFYLGIAGVPDLGARAVVLLPSGIVQVWTSSPGSWTRLS